MSLLLQQSSFVGLIRFFLLQLFLFRVDLLGRGFDFRFPDVMPDAIQTVGLIQKLSPSLFRTDHEFVAFVDPVLLVFDELFLMLTRI